MLSRCILEFGDYILGTDRLRLDLPKVPPPIAEPVELAQHRSGNTGFDWGDQRVITMQTEALGEPTSTHHLDLSGLDLVDLEQFPIDRADDPFLHQAIRRAREGLHQEGCARIGGFIRFDRRDALAYETDSLAPAALYSAEPYTPYGTPPEESFPTGHPRRRVHRTTIGNVTCDLIPTDALIQKLYHNEYFRSLIAACLEAEVIYEFADPMRSLTINTMRDGSYLGWHFDANEFVVSLMTRRAEAGGIFEYCPGIRAPGNENYEAVQAVLDGDRRLVKSLDLQVGDLQIFKGRYSLHRVTPVHGIRHTVLFGYAREPGFIGNVASTLRVYGRVMQAHIDAENLRNSDGLID